MNIKICFRETVDSTNLWAKQMAKEGAPEGTLAFADMQTAGRGRRGRAWASPPGTSIYMSLILRPAIRPEQASALTLVMGLSVAQGVQRVLDGLSAEKPAGCGDGLEAGTQVSGELRTGIKWPNDVVIRGKKICGILTEMSAGPEGVDYVVIGTGINVNNRSFSPELSDMASSLALEAGLPEGVTVSRSQVRDAVLEAFAGNYEVFLQSGDLRGLMEDYNQILANRNRQVRVLDEKAPFSGIARGINAGGALLVERDGQKLEAVCAGEVSVRGLYGYV